MGAFSKTLSIGDLRSDGLANEIARLVAEQPDLLPELIEALKSTDPSIRGHAADALEKVARSRPREVLAFLSHVIRLATTDEVAMVRWHLAMVLGHLSFVVPDPGRLVAPLATLLSDESAFVRSWAITSLCVIAREFPAQRAFTSKRIAVLTSDSSAAVAKRARIALRALADPAAPLPRTWVKSTCRPARLCRR